MPRTLVIEWLLDGDVAVRFQTLRDLMRQDEQGLQGRIAGEGQGAALLAARGMAVIGVTGSTGRNGRRATTRCWS